MYNSSTVKVIMAGILIMVSSSLFGMTFKTYKNLKAPKNMKASDGDYSYKIKITFDAVPHADKYRIYSSPRFYEGKQAVLEAATDHDDVNSVDITSREVMLKVTPKVKYHFWVWAMDSIGDTAEDFGLGKTMAYDSGYASGPPEKPKNFKANGEFSSEHISISFTPVKLATKYKVYRKIEGKTYDLMNIPEANSPNFSSWLDKSAKQGIVYVYKIEACREDEGCSTFAYSKAVSLRPAKPTFSCKFSLDDMIVYLDSVTDTTYKIQRSDSRNFTGKPVFDGRAPYYADQNLNTDTQYYYRVKAHNQRLNRDSYWSNPQKCPPQ